MESKQDIWPLLTSRLSQMASTMGKSNQQPTYQKTGVYGLWSKSNF